MIAKEVNDLETSYNVKIGDESRFKIEKKNIPFSFHVLIPYLKFYCIEEQSKREEFYEALPENAYKDLMEVFETIEPDLTYWLGGDAAQNKSISNEYYAICILSELNDSYVASQQGEDWQRKLREFSLIDQTKVNELLQLDEKELRNLWGIAADQYKRISFELSKLPENLKVLKNMLSLFAVEDDDEFWTFYRQLPYIAKKDMELVNLSLYQPIQDYLFNKGFMDELTKEETAVDKVRVILP